MSQKIELPENVRAIVEKLKDRHSFDAEKGKIRYNLDTFKETLPEGLDYETVTKVVNHQQDYALAVLHTAGNIAVDEMKKNKDLAEVPMVADVYHGKVKATVYREKESRNPVNGEVTQVKGALRASVVTSVPGSAFKAVKAHIGERAIKAGL